LNRIPIQVDDRLMLAAVIECRHLRIHRKLVKFAVDTGSSDNFLSQQEISHLQLPIKGKSPSGIVDVGGSRFEQIRLPEFKIHLLKENNELVTRNIHLFALKTTKKSEEKVLISNSLPSILGLSFLKELNFYLHVFMHENTAFIETE
jgi:hypothetical protein